MGSDKKISTEPTRILTDLEGILQTSAGAQKGNTPTMRKKKGSRGGRAARVSTDGITRHTSHAILLTISLIVVGRNPAPMVVVLGVSVFAMVALLLIKDVSTSAIAFTIRSRSKAGSVQVTVRVKTSAWDNTMVVRLLNLASIVIPPEDRAAYVEDQAANLDAIESRYEWLVYLLGQLIGIGQGAWQSYLEHRRESVK